MRQLRAGERLVGEATVHDPNERQEEGTRVIGRTFVETKRLLIEVAEQMERFDAHVRPLDGAFQEAPVVSAAGGVDLPVHVLFAVVHNVVNVLALQPLIREMGVGVEVRAGVDVLADEGLNVALLTATENPVRTRL